MHEERRCAMFEIMGTAETIELYEKELVRLKNKVGLIFQYKVWKDADVPNIDIWCESYTMNRIAFELGLIESEIPIYY